MHLSEKEGIEGARFTGIGGQGFVGAAQCVELIRRGALEICFLDLHVSSSWSQQLLDVGVRFFQGRRPIVDAWIVTHHQRQSIMSHEFDVKMLHRIREDELQVFLASFNEIFSKCQCLGNVCFLHDIST